MAEWGRGESAAAPPESRVSGKCDIYSVVEGDTSSFLPVERGPALGEQPQGPVGKWTMAQETRLSQRRTAVCGTEGLITHTLETRDQDYNRKNTSRAAVPACLSAREQTPHERAWAEL